MTTLSQESRFSQFLKSQLETKQKKNSSYSIRAFSRDLDISASTLSRILSGKLDPTLDITVRVIQKLGLTKLQEARALAKFAEGKSSTKNATDEIEKLYSLHSEKVAVRLDSWEHTSILESFNLDTPPMSILEIAKATGIAKENVEKRVRDLEEVGLLKRQERGWKKSSIRNTSGTEPKESTRKVIFEYLKLANTSMLEDPFESRHISGTTAAIDPDLLPEAYEMIREFRLQLVDFLTSGKRKEVYRLNLNLFPVRRVTK